MTMIIKWIVVGLCSICAAGPLLQMSGLLDLMKPLVIISIIIGLISILLYGLGHFLNAINRKD